MRYNLLGDIISIKSALLYKRGYVDVTVGRNPSGQLNAVKTNSSDSSSFMEYNFKFKVDKGIYSNFNIFKLLSDTTINYLSSGDPSKLDKKIGISVPNNLLMYQLGNTIPERQYSFFEIFTSEDLTEIIMDLDPQIQKVEFYDSILTYTFEDGVIPDVTEYNISNPNPLSPTPVMIIEFGPEKSYEEEDYYNKEEMDPKPDWDEKSEREYQMELDEYSNRKFLFITTTPDEGSSDINLSLYAHLSENVQHRFQDRYTIQNEDMIEMINDVNRTFSHLGDNDIVLDNRSNTILGTHSIESDNRIILNDKKKIASLKIPFVKIDKDEVQTTEYYNEYQSYVVYEKGDEVYYKGNIFRSCIDGNLSENPYSSSMWIQIDNEDDKPIERTDHIVNVRINDPVMGDAIPLGPITVEYGHELFIEIRSNKGYKLKEIYLDKIVQPKPLGNVYTVQNVIEDHDVFIEYEPILRKIKINVSPENSGTPYINGNAVYEDDYIIYSEILFNIIPNEGYEFVKWINSDGGLVSDKEEFIYTEFNDNLELTAILDKKRYDINIECSEIGGTFSPYESNPTTVRVIHGENLLVEFLPYFGYEIDFIVVDEIKYHRYKEFSYLFENVIKPHSIYIEYCRPKLVVNDPTFGELEYTIVGDQEWTMDNLSYDKLGRLLNDCRYFNGVEMQSIDNILLDGKTGFRVPSKEDWTHLYDMFDEKLASRFIKSSKLMRFDKYGWRDSIYRGYGLYRINISPMGSITKSEYEDTYSFDGLNEESHLWSRSLTKETASALSSKMYYDSPIAFLEENKLDTRYLPIRLVRPTPTVNILGTDYRYITYEQVFKIKVFNEDSIEDKYETHKITQKWILNNLNYKDLGKTYQDIDSDKFGSLYTLDETLRIDELLKSESHGFKVPSNIDFILLERYLGYGRDELLKMEDGSLSVNEDTFLTGYIGTTEGKRMKLGDFIYSNIDWYGYSSSDSENSRFELVPSGYINILNDSETFNGIGTISKLWSSTISNNLGMSRSVYYLSDKIMRGLDSGDSVRMSIRLVKTIDEIIQD